LKHDNERKHVTWDWRYLEFMRRQHAPPQLSLSFSHSSTN